MHSLYIEHRPLNGKTLLSWDLAHHIYIRGVQGRIAVVADKPTTLLADTRKQWLKIMRHVQRERSSTLSSGRIKGLDEQLAWMQSLTFSAKPPDDTLEADITFATAENFVRVPPECSVVYITYSFEKEKLHMLTSWMPKSGRVIIYE